MLKTLFLIFTSLIFFTSAQFGGDEYWEAIQLKSNGGGIECAACSIGVSLLEQLSQIHEKPIDKVLDEICGFFPSPIKETCDYFVLKYGGTVIKLIENRYDADQVCHSIQFCTDAQCKIYPNKKRDDMPEIVSFPPGPQFDPFEWLKDLFLSVANHKPDFDFDEDNYSIQETLRGYAWRGRDCDDISAEIHPGKIDNGTDYDYNCNGIKGQAANGTSWEDLLCKGSDQMGTIVVGDSAGAHFHIPPKYMNASLINENTYDDILFVLSNEFDWPQLAATTAWEPPTLEKPDHSIYKKMKERNLCNFRDFQNCGVNGCRTSSMNSTVIRTIARNAQKDHPVLMIFELIGNDVCSPHHDFTHMTTVPEFRERLISILDYLDNGVLPKGSHIVFQGLADGLVLWENLHNRTHPLGVTYEAVYDFLNCLEISPCWVWMNKNQTVREIGQKRANELSAVYNEVISKYAGRWKNFDMAYYPFPLKGIQKLWGGPLWQLIEKVDGFHPNQIANNLWAQWIWSTLEKDHPDWLPRTNPHNDEIKKRFGNQGGYG